MSVASSLLRQVRELAGNGAPAPGAVHRPPATKGHVSVVNLAHQWFIACNSADLGHRPVSRTLQGVPLVLFRDGAGQPCALLDRCPHRNVPLSMGRCRNGMVECAYHGWRFDGDGHCRDIPGLCGQEPGAPARRADSHACMEQDGYVWVYSTPNVTPQDRPFAFPQLGPGYTVVQRDVPMQSTMHGAVENALDVPHTGFLHGGLFRTATKKNRVRVVIRRGSGHVEAEYLDEPRPTGLVGRLLAPNGGLVTHFDRFFLPCVAQVEYRMEQTHMLITSAFTPISDFETRAFAHVAFKVPVVGGLLKPIMLPIAMRIFRQDAGILAAQTATIQRFGGEQFAHTEIDVLGPHIWHLLRQAERGLKGDDAQPEIHREMMT